ncbi:MAG: hypothetical protein OXP71_17720 [Candidatus Poribacteria bacterium]|nr:hypothetical protein [Candidatus Poribacteria bacterium]
MISTNNLTRRKISKIADQFRGEFAGRDKGLFLLAVSTGSRMTELLVLTISDVYKNGKPANYLRLNRDREILQDVPCNKDDKKVIQSLIDWHIDRYGQIDTQRPLFPSRTGGGKMAVTSERSNEILRAAFKGAGLIDGTRNRNVSVRSLISNLLKVANLVRYVLEWFSI